MSDDTLTDAQWVYQRRVKRGVCIRCEGPRTNKEFKTCLDCRLEQRATRKSLGRSLLCSQCKRPVVKGKLCEECRHVRTEKNRERYEERLAAGLCPQCGGKRAKRSKKKLCGRCLKRIKKHAPDLRAKRKELGLCTRCGSRESLPESTQCFECREKVNEGHRRRRRERPGSEAERAKRYREDMKAKGLCYKCGEPAAKDRTTCQSCLDKSAEAGRIARSRKKVFAVKKHEPDSSHPKRKLGRMIEEPVRLIR